MLVPPCTRGKPGDDHMLDVDANNMLLLDTKRSTLNNYMINEFLKFRSLSPYKLVFQEWVLLNGFVIVTLESGTDTVYEVDTNTTPSSRWTSSTLYPVSCWYGLLHVLCSQKYASGCWETSPWNQNKGNPHCSNNSSRIPNRRSKVSCPRSRTYHNVNISTLHTYCTPLTTETLPVVIN